MEKLNLQLYFDKIFRKTIFLRPLPDKTFEVVDITGQEGQYVKDKAGATAIIPSNIYRVRGLKNVSYVATKLHGSSSLADMFGGSPMIVKHPPISVPVPPSEIKLNAYDFHTCCPECQKEIVVPIPEAEIPAPSLPDIKVEVPDTNIIMPSDIGMTEKTFGDMLNYAEIAGRMQAEPDTDKDKKMNMLLILVAGAIVFLLFIYYKINSGGQ